jgi:hypothetical protein
LNGQINIETDLTYFKLFTIAGNVSKDDERKASSLWVNVTSNITELVQLVNGGGSDNKQMEDLIYGKIEQNFVIYNDLIFSIAYRFSISLKV